MAEVLVYTGKVSQLIRLSNEQYGQDGTAAQLAASVGRAIVRRADQALDIPGGADTARDRPGNRALNTAGVVDGGAIGTSLDGLVDLIAELQANLSTPTHIVLGPLGWSELRKFRSADGYNTSLLGAGTTDAVPMVLSLPVIVNVAVAGYEGLVIDRSAVVSAVEDQYLAYKFGPPSEACSLATSSTISGMSPNARFSVTAQRPTRLRRQIASPMGRARAMQHRRPSSGTRWRGRLPASSRCR